MLFKTPDKFISSYFILILTVLISTFILWFPFLARFDSWMGLKIDNSNFQYIYKQYDGPLYIVAAKTLYDPKKIDTPDKGLILSLPLGAKYFAAHLPLYPLLIRGFREFGCTSLKLLGVKVFGVYLKSMVFVNVFFTLLAALFFYFMVKKLDLSKNPLILSCVFLFLPRFLVVRSVGAPESLFIFLILMSIYFFEKERFGISGLFGGLAAMTKTPGILLFIAYFLVIIERIIKHKNIEARWLWLLLIPLGLLGVFGFYYIQYGDFFAYFHSGDNIHLAYPFAAFNFQNRWVGSAWLEDILFYFFLYLSSIYSLRNNKHRSFFYFSLIFFTATTFIQHRDIARYSLPLWPLALIAFEKFFTSKKFIIVLFILLPAIYLYAWNFLLYNVIPIADWSPFL